ncbi:hypothetical protein THOG05_140017 [Vibrio rotiferianus]|nr:hypothetical protein THOG05_140017 [Vibrio rotiferianus]CAH1574276.1 hypothetical protein THOG10_220035 [Vibrio rotiferianus]CAH1576288.1 hypothetical protein THOB06_220035 [Vibrio rotiferianus]CAH1582232.1 hypothetical protein THOE12_60309 [Vibrio rotiferianus]
MDFSNFLTIGYDEKHLITQGYLWFVFVSDKVKVLVVAFMEANSFDFVDHFS